MTTKRRITSSLSDVCAFDLECAKCHTGVRISLPKIDWKLPQSCPNCKARWGAYDEDSAYQPKSQHTMDYARAVAEAIETFSKKNMEGFTFSLELSHDVSTRDV